MQPLYNIGSARCGGAPTICLKGDVMWEQDQVKLQGQLEVVTGAAPGKLRRKGLGCVLGTAALLALTLTACSSSPSEDEQLSAAEQAEVVSEVETQAQEGALANPLFMGRVIYLRGEMNDYGVQRPYRLREFAPNSYCTLAPLRSDWSPYRFKFADDAWSAGTNFGYAVPPAIIREGSGRILLNPNSRFEEVRYEPKQDGIYRFCIEYEDTVPYVTVTHLEDGKLTSLEEMMRAEIEREFAVSASASTAASRTAADASDDEDNVQ